MLIGILSSPPYSDGPLQLPFQRPAKQCRTFKSDLVDKVIDDTEGRADVLPRGLISRHAALSNEGYWLEADALLVNVRTNTYSGRIDWKRDPPVVNAEYTKEGLQ